MTSHPRVQEASSPLMWTWGDGVRAYRGMRQLTQAQLAGKANTTQARISEIEAGRRTVPDALRLRIARALDLDPYQLFPYVDTESS